jgi:cell wall assembly regulator SMI1
LEAWFHVHAPEVVSSLNRGLTEAQLESREKQLGQRLPEDLRESYKLHDGQDEEARLGLVFGIRLIPLYWGMQEREGFAAVESARVVPEGTIQPFQSHPSWIPVTRDSGGNYLGVDLAPGPKGQVGQVIVFGLREPTNYVVAPSWKAFLEHLLHMLESGNVELGEKDQDGFRDFDTLEPKSSHFHDYVRKLYERNARAGQDRPKSPYHPEFWR